MSEVYSIKTSVGRVTGALPHTRGFSAIGLVNPKTSMNVGRQAADGITFSPAFPRMAAE